MGYQVIRRARRAVRSPALVPVASSISSFVGHADSVRKRSTSASVSIWVARVQTTLPIGPEMAGRMAPGSPAGFDFGSTPSAPPSVQLLNAAG